MLALPAIVLRPSRRLLLWVQLLYGLVALVCLSLPWPALARLALAAVIVVDGWWQYRRLRQCYGFSGLRVNAEHQLQMQRHGEGSWLNLPLCAPCHLLPGLVILQLRQDGRIRRLVLEPAMMEREEWRRLRVWMKWRLPELLPPQASLWSRLRALWSAVRGAKSSKG